MKSLEELAYQTIKERIIRLEYKPGQTLTESGLAEELQISRQPVRAAVKQLAMEGLLVNDYYRKLMVKPVTSRDVREIYQLRTMLETAAMKQIFAAGRQQEYSYRLEEKTVRMRAAGHDYYKWESADAEFHKEIISIFESSRIDKIYSDNLAELVRIGLLSDKQYEHIDSINARLSAFIGFMREGNYEDAYGILYEDHLNLGLDLALKATAELK